MDAAMRKAPEEPAPQEAWERAREYRLLAATATAAQVRDGLLEVARMLEQRAAQKEAESGSPCPATPPIPWIRSHRSDRSQSYFPYTTSGMTEGLVDDRPLMASNDGL